MKVELKNIASIFNGKTPSKAEQRDMGFPVLKIKDIDENGFFKGNFDCFVDQELADGLLKKHIQVGDILILNAAHNSKYVGSKKCFASEDFAGALATGEWTIVRPNQNKVLPKFLYFILDTAEFQFQLQNVVKGIHLYPKDLNEIKIFCPSLEEQKRIVRELDTADALRQKRKQAIALLDNYLKAVFLEMFGPNANGFNDWEEVQVQDLAKKRKGSMRTGPFGSDLRHSEFVDEGVAVIGIDNAVQNKFSWDQRRFITEEKYQKLKRYTLYPGDVIITIMGTTGRSAVIPRDIPLSINTKHLVAITLDPDLTNPYFLSYSIHSNPAITEQINRKNRGAIMSGLNLGLIRGLTLKRPPVEHQNRFEKLYEKVEQLKRLMWNQSVELDVNFNALMQKYLANNLD